MRHDHGDEAERYDDIAEGQQQDGAAFAARSALPPQPQP